MNDYPFQVTLGSIVFLIEGALESVVAWANDHDFIMVTSLYNGEIVFSTPVVPIKVWF